MPPSPVVVAWEGHDYLVAAASRGSLVVWSSPDKLTRMDVVNNADMVGPLVSHLGTLPHQAQSSNILWVDKILHHFESMVEAIVGWYLQLNRIIAVFLGGAGFCPSTVAWGQADRY